MTDMHGQKLYNVVSDHRSSAIMHRETKIIFIAQPCQSFRELLAERNHGLDGRSAEEIAFLHALLCHPKPVLLSFAAAVALFDLTAFGDELRLSVALKQKKRLRTLESGRP